MPYMISTSDLLATNGAIQLLYDGLLAVAPAVGRRRLFFVLISALVGQSLHGEGRAIRSHYYQLTPQRLLLNSRL